MAKKVMTGIVMANNNNKTIVVRVDHHRRHPLYSKSFKVSKKFAAHDENNKASIGDKVQIVETRPISRTKHWQLQEIVTKAQGSASEPQEVSRPEEGKS